MSPESFDPSRIERADVYKGDSLVARLTRMGGGVIDFRYLPDAIRAGGPQVAFRLPVRSEPVQSTGGSVPPFFANLLPEGARLFALRDRVKASADDMLSLLLAVGGDCVGDVRVVPENEAPPEFTPRVGAREWGEVSFAELFAGSVSTDSSFYDPAALPGVQEKVSDAMIVFPVAAKAGPHLLKLNPPGFPRVIENEDFFLRMARAVGISTVSARVVKDKSNASGLLIERFDRRRQESGRVERLAVEDGCQICDLYPADKYRVRTLDIASAFAEVASSPAATARGLIAVVAFSYVIGNEDLHAKNVSLVQEADGIVGLSPVYDLLTTLPYAVDHKLAMEFEGRQNRLRREDFMSFGARLNVGDRAVSRSLDRLCDLAPAWLDRLGEIGFEDRVTDRLRAEMRSRLDRLGK
ncbi:MAG TPA: HipA domain-containing protein [Acidimicrobiia bacterium]|nr:HipA domain-containing protein [Acidimicrobiia bacterium]